MSPLLDLAPLLVAIGAFGSVLFTFYAAMVVRDAMPRPAAVGPSLPAPPSASSQGLHIIADALAAPSEAVERSHIRTLLIQAGWRGPNNLAEFVALRAGMALLLPLGAVAIFRPATPLGVVSVVLVLVAVGYYGPGLVIHQRRAERMDRLARAFPNALDMLVSVVDGGLGIDAALVHVARELDVAAPELAEEFELVNLELRAGLPRMEALHHLHARTGVDEIGSLVNVLSQAERYGSGISQSLRAHAHLSRRRRALEAEKRAAKASPKLTIAMILFILPTLFVVLIGPTIVNISLRLLPTLEGGAP
jgi:tight adherence protein C